MTKFCWTIGYPLDPELCLCRTCAEARRRQEYARLAMEDRIEVVEAGSDEERER